MLVSRANGNAVRIRRQSSTQIGLRRSPWTRAPNSRPTSFERVVATLDLDVRIQINDGHWAFSRVQWPNELEKLSPVRHVFVDLRRASHWMHERCGNPSSRDRGTNHDRSYTTDADGRFELRGKFEFEALSNASGRRMRNQQRHRSRCRRHGIGADVARARSVRWSRTTPRGGAHR